MKNRFVFIRPLANGCSFPEGIHDTVTGKDLMLENDILKVKDYLEEISRIDKKESKNEKI